MGVNNKQFISTMQGAPVLSGTAGALIAVLDAVLVNGFGLQTASSVVVASGIATVTVPVAHGLPAESVVLMAGATPAGLNGEKRVLSVTTMGFTFDATGISDQTATGSITMKVAGAGWTKPYSGTNIAVYRNNTVTGTGMFLRVDDTTTTSATARGYESMSDANTGLGPFPSVAQSATGSYFTKSDTASAAARTWHFFADSRGFWYLPRPHVTNERQSFYFGDVLSYRTNDPYGCVLRAYPAASITAGAYATNSVEINDAAFGYLSAYFPRAANAIGGSAAYTNAPVSPTGMQHAICVGSPNCPLVYPSQVDNGLMLAQVQAFNANGVRGLYPGLLVSPQYVTTSFSTDDIVNGTGANAGKKFKVIKVGASTATSNQGVLFFDLLTDWR